METGKSSERKKGGPPVAVCVVIDGLILDGGGSGKMEGRSVVEECSLEYGAVEMLDMLVKGERNKKEGGTSGMHYAGI